MLELNLIILILCSVEIICSRGQGPPKVSINFPDAADSDFCNDTLAEMSNSNVIYELECMAEYPVEWVFHYSDEDDGTSEKVKRAETHRLVTNFGETETYKYLAKIRVEYNGKLLVLVNYTCKAAQTDISYFQTHVYMKDRNRKSIIILEVSTENRGYFQGSSDVDKNNCSNAVTTVSYDETVDWNPCWTCETPDGTELELDFEHCLSPIQCNSMHSRQNKGKNCLKFMDREQRPRCKRSGEVELIFNPKLIICKNFGAALSQLYFSGVFRGDRDNYSSYGPSIYYDWSDIDPSEMIYMHPTKPVVYRGEQVQITCEYSNFYFSLGSWFGIETGHGMEYIKGEDLKPCGFGPKQNHNCSDEIIWKGTYSAVLLKEYNELGLHQVYCYGPIWNTTEWVNTSAEFMVEQGEIPQVISLEPDKKEEYIVGDRERRLRCNFRGIPTPTVTWTPASNWYSVENGESYSDLVFSEIGYQTANTYKCTVSSFLGNHSKSFILKSYAPTTKLGTLPIVAISLSCLVVAGIVLVVIYRMRKIIVEQQEALRLLTEAEIEEFIQGNPDIVEKAKKEYFNNASVIDALPYDKKYEIPPDKLAIDYTQVLGSGEFGMVLWGKVQKQSAAQYVNIAMIPDRLESGADSDNGTLEVAIKICKKDVDVTSFKALLSEIKVMAYLGHHKNIVSLIGASTDNIRNRELYVAIEYCHNGSLEQYVRQNKTRFLNKVKYGFYVDDEDVSTGYLNISGSLPPQTSIFSSIELFKWTNDIADAVEYIHSKRVIHGDLAIRNVMLTKDLSAKVGDFGLSRQLVDTASYTKRTQCPLPWRNMAIESLKNLEFSVKTDMWSLGVTLWEMYTLGEVPYPGITYSMDFIKSLEDGSLRLVKPSFATNDIYEFMLMCWQNNPDDRPTTSEIKAVCHKLLTLMRAS